MIDNYATTSRVPPITSITVGVTRIKTDDRSSGRAPSPPERRLRSEERPSKSESQLRVGNRQLPRRPPGPSLPVRPMAGRQPRSRRLPTPPYWSVPSGAAGPGRTVSEMEIRVSTPGRQAGGHPARLPPFCPGAPGLLPTGGADSAAVLLLRVPSTGSISDIGPICRCVGERITTSAVSRERK